MRLQILLATLALCACGDDDDRPAPNDGGVPLDAASPLDAALVPDAALDAASDAAAPITPPSDCFLNPRSYLEIINACTDAEKVTKNPVLPLLGADGKLPPLP